MWQLQLMLAQDRIAERRREADAHRVAILAMRQDRTPTGAQRIVGNLRSALVTRQA